MTSIDCSECGVAYDVGYKFCREKGCLDVESLPVILAPKTKKIYGQKRQKPLPKHISRWQSAKARANKRLLPFDLTPDFVQTIMTSPCTYCTNGDNFSELDKKEPSLGYVMDNVVPACRRCNTVKNNVISYDEMMFIATHLKWRS